MTFIVLNGFNRKSHHYILVHVCVFRDGNLQDIVDRGSLHEFLVGLHEQFGPVASFWFGRQPVVSLGSVDPLRQHINPNHTSTGRRFCLFLCL